MGWLSDCPQLNYERCQTLLGAKLEKKIAHNTTLRKAGDSGNFIVKYHATDIITFMPSGNYQINIGGWHTATTRDRLNIILPSRSHIKDGVLYHNDIALSGAINFRPDGTPLDAQYLKRKEDSIVGLKKKIKEYVKIFVEKMVDGKIEKPSAGDCFFCSLKTDEGKTMGDLSKSSAEDHILAHIKEKYYVPSLFVNAVFASDAPVGPMIKQIFFEIWQGNKMEETFRSLCVRQAKAALLKYIERRVVK